MIGGLFLAIVYCLAFGISARPYAPVPGHFQLRHAASPKEVLSEAPTNIFWHATRSEISAVSLLNHPAPAFKILFSDIGTAVLVYHHVVRSGFSRYKFFERTLAIARQRSKLIFPFHQFW